MMRFQMRQLPEAASATETLAQFKNLRAGLFAGAIHLRGQFAKYPPQKRPTRENVYGSPFKTEKQRRWFWASVRSGALKLPYVRGVSGKSESLAKRWVVESQGGGLRQVIGNYASYVEYVQGDKQSLYMKEIGWQKAGLIAGREFNEVNKIVQSYAKKDVS